MMDREEKKTLSRREFFSSWRELLLTKSEQGKPPAPRGLPGFLRPPGALPEAEFIEKCDRECTECLKVCPAQCVVQLGPAYQEKDKTPVILPRSRACAMCDDVACASVCPTGALQPVQKEDIALGRAVINEDTCFAYQGQPCDYCFTQCPLEQKAIAVIGDKPLVLEGNCTGCGQCLYICPAPGDGAIEINGLGRTTKRWEA